MKAKKKLKWDKRTFAADHQSTGCKFNKWKNVRTRRKKKRNGKGLLAWMVCGPVLERNTGIETHQTINPRSDSQGCAHRRRGQNLEGDAQFEVQK